MHLLEISTPQQQVARVGLSVESALIALAAIFWLIVRTLTIFDKKYRILTRRDKRESVCNKTMFRFAKNVRLASLRLSLALSGSL